MTTAGHVRSWWTGFWTRMTTLDWWGSVWGVAAIGRSSRGDPVVEDFREFKFSPDGERSICGCRIDRYE